ncbi:MAG TPA: universal stress protein [Verrucomicrobiae bacterium]|nr:universal stress protein [Verrucomicrobiae bacterium]
MSNVTVSPPTTARAARPQMLVVGIDGSLGSQSALEWALREAQLRRVGVRAVAVWSDPLTLVGPPPPVAYGGEVTQSLRRMLDQAVEGALRVLGPPLVAVRREVRSGEAAQVLTALARPGDLLVVGSRGLGGVRRLLLGSVSQRCAQLATTAVVIVPPVSPAAPPPDQGR